MSNALNISKNTARISLSGSQIYLRILHVYPLVDHSQNFEKISWFINTSWSTQESSGRKPDWLALSSSFSSMYLKST